MPPSDYDLFRQRVDEQLRANLRTVYESYLVQVRAGEILAVAQGAAETGLRPPLALSAALDDAEPARLLPAAGAPALPAETPPAEAAAPAAPAPPDPDPPPEDAVQPKRSGRFELYNAVLDVLPQLDEVFDRDDLARLLPVPPKRSSLLGVLHDLVHRDRELEIAEKGTSGALTLYRKRKPAPGRPG